MTEGLNYGGLHHLAFLRGSGACRSQAVVLATPVEVAVGNKAPSFALATLDGSKMIGIALDEGGVKAVQPFVKKNKSNDTVLLGNEKIFNRFKW